MQLSLSSHDVRVQVKACALSLDNYQVAKLLTNQMYKCINVTIEDIAETL